MKTCKEFLTRLGVVFSLLLLVAACSKDNSQEAAPELKADYELPGVELMESPQWQEASEEVDLALLDDGMPDDLEAELQEEMGLEQLLNSHPLRCSRKQLLDSLNLDSSQVRQIKRALIARHKCSQSLFKRIRQHNQQVIQKARQERQDLLQDFRAGNIDRQQLKQALVQLNRRTFKALVNQADRPAIIRAIRHCHRDFLGQLSGILNGQQIATWQAFHQRCRH